MAEKQSSRPNTLWSMCYILVYIIEKQSCYQNFVNTSTFFHCVSRHLLSVFLHSIFLFKFSLRFRYYRFSCIFQSTLIYNVLHISCFTMGSVTRFLTSGFFLNYLPSRSPIITLSLISNFQKIATVFAAQGALPVSTTMRKVDQLHRWSHFSQGHLLPMSTTPADLRAREYDS